MKELIRTRGLKILIVAIIISTLITIIAYIKMDTTIVVTDLSNDKNSNSLLLSQAQLTGNTLIKRYNYNGLLIELKLSSGEFTLMIDGAKNNKPIGRSLYSSLRNSYSLAFTNYDGDCCIVESDRSYGMAGVEEVSHISIYNTDQILIKELGYQTMINIESFKNDYPEAGTPENPYFFMIDRVPVSEPLYKEELIKIFNEKSVVLIALGYGGAGTIDILQ